jgi:selenocysteine lyase/cysteine desulfurase
MRSEGVAGALAAVEYIASVGDRFGSAYASEFPGFTGRRLALKTAMRAIRVYEMELFERLLAGLEAIPGVRIWGVTDRDRLAAERTPTAAITLDACSPRAAAEALGRQAITTWDGDFYAQALIERLGLFEAGGVLRIGISHYNTAAEIDRLLAALREIAGPR